jgi:streptomycin 6-kinase
VSPPVDVPELVRQRAESHGAPGRAWLERLPELVATLAEQWELRLGSAFDGGTAACVLAAMRADGSECVLKVPLLIDDTDRVAFERSVIVHRLAEGRGCAELLSYDTGHHAMLIERLGPNLHDLGLATDAVLDAIAETLKEFWRPVGPDVDLPTGAAKAEWLATYITTTWDALDRPVERRVIDLALELCERRSAAFVVDRSVLVHGDAHGWNTLVGRHGDGDEHGRCKLVNPEGVLSSPEHDLAVPMREYNEPLLEGDTARLVRERAEHLAMRCDADPDAVWEWGYIERVSTGLSSLQHFTSDSGSAFLEVARRCT